MPIAEVRNLTRYTALVLSQGRIFISQTDGLATRPFSPVVNLIQNMYEHDHGQARSILRNRIFTNYEPTIMCKGMIKVAAKRHGGIEDREIESLIAHHETKFFNLECGRPFTASHEEMLTNGALTNPAEVFVSEEIFMVAASTLAKKVPTQNFRHQSHREVASILVGPNREILALGQNSNAQNKTLHAEVNMIQGYYAKTQKLLPVGSKIFTTLKPCVMCAAMIWHCAENPHTIEVVYGEDDQGCFTNQTILEVSGIQRRLTFAPS